MLLWVPCNAFLFAFASVKEIPTMVMRSPPHLPSVTALDILLASSDFLSVELPMGIILKVSNDDETGHSLFLRRLSHWEGGYHAVLLST
jgi:hypothetical protein